jgi:hypothetical protein
MAEQAEKSRGKSVLGGAVEMIAKPVLAVAVMTAVLWNRLTADGHIAAAGRQGLDELGAALKAFPDSMQVHETGTLWNPTQGEVAASRQQSRHTGNYKPYSSSSPPPHPWPSEIAANNRQRHAASDHGLDQGQEHGHEAGQSL